MAAFDTSAYYDLYSDSYGSDRSLSCFAADPPDAVAMTSTGRFISQNWQFYYQDGVYFIRNYAHNTTFHLGISSTDLSTPVMLPATTDLGQQWTVDAWDDGSPTYRLSNKLVDVYALGQFMGIGESFNIPIMSSSQSGARWTIAKNQTVGNVSEAMLLPYISIQTSLSATPSATGTALPAPTFTGSNSPDEPHGLSGLAKTGIIVGAVVFATLMLTAILLFRRYKRTGHLAAQGVPGPQPSPRPPRHGCAEELPEPPPAYNARGSTLSQAPTLTSGIVSWYGPNGTKHKAADEESIELPSYSRPSVESRSFV